MIEYLIKSTLCLLVLWGFYTLVLEGQAANRLKRVYLLLSLLCALILPLVTFTYATAALPEPEIIQQPIILQQVDAMQLTVVEPSIDWIFWIIGAVYLLGVLIFAFRFARNLYRLRRSVVTNEKQREPTHTKVLLAQKTIPHSFLRYIFLNKTEYAQHQIAPEILAHEQAHVSGRHSWDILFIELLQVVFWFNPLLVLVKRSMAMNHEFLADEAALGGNQDPDSYINLLFHYSGGTHHAALSSPINYSLTRPPYRRAKKRILMLSRSFSAKKLATRLTLLIPVLALCIYFFNQDIVAKPIVENAISETKHSDWLQIYVEKDKTIIINNKTTDLKNLTAVLSNFTYAKKSEREKKLKILLYIDPRLSSDFIIQIDKKLYEFGIYSLIGKGLTVPIGNDPKFNEIQIDYKNALKLQVKDQFKNYEWFATFDLSGEGLSNEKIKSGLDSISNSSTGYIQKYPTLSIIVEGSIVNVNGKSSSLENFVGDIDKIAIDWTKEDMMNYSIRLNASSGMDEVLTELTYKFRKTKIYKINRSKELIQPPSLDSPDFPVVKAKHLIEVIVDGDKISFKGRTTNLANFAEAIDELTENWTDKEFETMRFASRYIKSSLTYIQSLGSAMKQTNYYKKTRRSFLPPLAPPPIKDPSYKKINKIIDIMVEGDTITLEGRKTNLANFVKTVNDLTKNWTKKQYEETTFSPIIYKSSETYIEKFRSAMKQTNYYKKTGRSFLPPPPPPPAPRAPAAPKSPTQNENTEFINIEIDKNKNVYLNRAKIDLNDLENQLLIYNKEFTKQERQKMVNAYITVDPNVEMGVITDVKNALYNYGIKKLKVYPPDVFQKKPVIPAEPNALAVNAPYSPAASRTPAVPKSPIKNSSVNDQNVKILYFNIREDHILLNDKKVLAVDFAKTLDGITKDWTQKELANASIRFYKTSLPDSKIKPKLEEEYKKTALFKARPDHGLIPPPPATAAPAAPSMNAPPSPPSPPAPPIPPNPNEMIKEITAAGGDIYYNGKKISEEDAKKLISNNDTLNFMYTGTGKSDKPMLLITDGKATVPSGTKSSLSNTKLISHTDFFNPNNLIKQFKKYGGSIKYNDKVISADQAKKLVDKNDSFEFVYTGNPKDNSPMLLIMDKK